VTEFGLEVQSVGVGHVPFGRVLLVGKNQFLEPSPEFVQGYRGLRLVIGRVDLMQQFRELVLRVPLRHFPDKTGLTHSFLRTGP